MQCGVSFLVAAGLFLAFLTGPVAAGEDWFSLERDRAVLWEAGPWDSQSIQRCGAGQTPEAVRRAWAGLSYRLGMVSDLDARGSAPGNSTAVVLHGNFTAGQTVRLLSAGGDRTATARTGTAYVAENVYGIPFTATPLDLKPRDLAGLEPFLAAAGDAPSAYRIVEPAPVTDPGGLARLEQQVAAAPGLCLTDEKAPDGPAPLRRRKVAVMAAASQQWLLAIYGGYAEFEPSVLLLLRDREVSQIWLGCGDDGTVFRLGEATYFAHYFQSGGAGRRGLYVYLLENAGPRLVYRNIDFAD